MKVFHLLLLLLLASATAMASIDPQDLTVQRDVTSNTVIIRSIVALERTAEVRLMSASGITIYADSVAVGNFINKRFPAAAFAGKAYSLIVTDALGKTTQPLAPRADSGFMARASDGHRQLFPRVDLRSERTLVVDYENTSGKRVDIRIANQAGQTVFEDKVSGTTSVQRAYQLDQLAEGQYQLIVSARDVKRHTTAFALR